MDICNENTQDQNVNELTVSCVCRNVARYAQKPMEAGDYDRVEQQLMSQLQPVATKGLHNMQSWSSAPHGQSLA